MSIASPFVPSGIARWNVRVAGSFAVTEFQSGKDVTPRGRKARAIIAYLAARPDARVGREKITELLWGDRGEAQARASLRQALLEIRHSAPELIGSDRGHVWLNESSANIDAIPISEGEGEFVPFEDLDHISSEFDDWLEIERSRRKRDASALLRTVVERHLAAGRGASALNLIEAMWRIDPYSEDALRLALQAEYQAGHPAAIEQRFQAMDALLRDDLGVEPAAETRALHDRLLASLKERQSHGPQRSRSQPGSDRLRWSWQSLLAALLVPVAGLAVVASRQDGVAGVAQKRVAVLPFLAFNGVEPVMAEGMAEELLTQLSRQDGIQTVGRTSSWMFTDKAEDVRNVGKKLDADYVVQGDLRQTDRGLHAKVELIDAEKARTVWSQSFVSPSGNMQRIEFAAAGALMRKLGLAQPTAAPQTDSRAFDNYTRAKALIRDRDWLKMREARDLLRQAITIDPNFAPAWAQLGGVLNFLAPQNETFGDKEGEGWQQEALAAARRSVELDPNLAEGHAMLAFIYGFDSEEGRAHLRRALVLDPNNPQTIYWSGIAASYSGDYAANEKAVRRALAIDPLWRRPIEVVGQWAIWQGRRAEAYQYVTRLRSADPSAAVEIEMSFAREEGDLSRVVEIGRRDPMIASTTAARMSLAWSLIELGYTQEGLLLGEADPFDRLLQQGRLPGRQAIMDHLRPFIGYSEELFMIRPVMLELMRTGRCADVAAIYDQPESRVHHIGKITDGNRESRLSMAGLVGWCLTKVGRTGEARQLFRAADEAGRVILSNRVVGPVDLIAIATNDAVMGRRELSLERLEKAVAKGWFTYEGFNFKWGEAPWFASLQGDPRFERLRKITAAKLQRERRETEALGVV